MSIDDPVLRAINRMAEILEPFDRTDQLRVLASTCISFGMLDEADQFILQLRADRGEP